MAGREIKIWAGTFFVQIDKFLPLRYGYLGNVPLDFADIK